MAHAKGIMAIERGIMSAHSRDILLRKQGHSCAICGEMEEKLVLDHDHSTGQVRGFLCNSCNIKIGHVERNGGVNISEPLYNQVLDYLHSPPITRSGIAFLGQLKTAVSNGLGVHGEQISYPKKLREMVLQAPDYMAVEEFIDFLGPLEKAAKEVS
jgi:hypothetical protein